MFEEAELQRLFRYILEKAGVSCEEKATFPLIIRKGKNAQGKEVTFYLNYSKQEQSIVLELEEEVVIAKGSQENCVADRSYVLEPWGVCVTER